MHHNPFLGLNGRVSRWRGFPSLPFNPSDFFALGIWVQIIPSQELFIWVILCLRPFLDPLQDLACDHHPSGIYCVFTLRIHPARLGKSTKGLSVNGVAATLPTVEDAPHPFGPVGLMQLPGAPYNWGSIAWDDPGSVVGCVPICVMSEAYASTDNNICVCCQPD